MKNFQESFEIINDYLQEFGIAPLTEKEAKQDFGINGSETHAQLKEWAGDFAGECHAEKCIVKNEFKYTV